MSTDIIEPNSTVHPLCLSHIMTVFAASYTPYIRKYLFLQMLPAWRETLVNYEKENGVVPDIVIFTKGCLCRVKALPYDIAQRFAVNNLPNAVLAVRQIESLTLQEEFSHIDELNHYQELPIEEEDETMFKG